MESSPCCVDPRRCIASICSAGRTVDHAADRLAGDGPTLLEALGAAAAAATEVDRSLRGLNAASLLADLRRVTELRSTCERLNALADRIEAAEAAGTPADQARRSTPGWIALRDPSWAIARDRLRAAVGIVDLMGVIRRPVRWRPACRCTRHSRRSTWLEVAVADSAGIQLLVTGHGLDLDSPQISALLEARRMPLFGSGGGAHPGRCVELRVQGCCRDWGTGRQHRRFARKYKTMSC